MLIYIPSLKGYFSQSFFFSKNVTCIFYWINIYKNKSLCTHSQIRTSTHTRTNPCTHTYMCKYVVLFPKSTSLTCPVSWACRKHRRLLSRGIRPPQLESWVWQWTIWWWCSSSAGALDNAEYLFIAIKVTLVRSEYTWLRPIYGSNRTKLCTYAKLNYLK